MKSAPISVRLPQDVYEMYMEEIERLGGVSNSEFFRALILDNFDPDKLDKAREKDIKKLLFYYNKASNNINQIAKSVNTEMLKGGLKNDVLLKILTRLDLILNSFESGIRLAKNEQK